MKLTTKLLTTIIVLAGMAGLANGQMSKEAQAAATPDSILKDLMAGNANFAAGNLTKIDMKAERAAVTAGQFPKAVILSCLDSRVPVEMVFDQGFGDLFVGRVAGNVENVDQLGSMEFATKLAGAKVILVLGHSSCGAVKGACDGAKMGNLTELLAKITPAVEAVKGHEAEGRNSKNAKFVAAVVEKNVQMTVADIRKNSEVLTALEKEGKLKIVGGVYDLETGKVSLVK
jgi:carbonic anhydrase